MSASPPQPTQSAKRPLEEPSSPSRAGDQPEAKRPALDKVIRNDEETKALDESVETPVEAAEQNGDEETNGAKAEPAETAATDAGSEVKVGAATVASTSAAANSAAAHDETSWIHIRAVISSPEAATVIGKGGENVSNIRKMSNAKCTVSDYQKGAVERILTVSGIVDAVAKVG
jgi:poly(rC)-binding protein 2/3/4